ncbi:hypothetical protein P3T23_002385 [Paraburkholderia sp. GAS448]
MTATTTRLTCSLRKGQVSGAEPPHDCQRERSYQRPHLEALADKLEDTIYFVVRRGDFAVCYARAEGAFPIKTLTLRVGDRRPLGVGSSSLAIAAALSDDEVQRLLRDQRAEREPFRFTDASKSWPRSNGNYLICSRICERCAAGAWPPGRCQAPPILRVSFPRRNPAAPCPKTPPLPPWTMMRLVEHHGCWDLLFRRFPANYIRVMPNPDRWLRANPSRRFRSQVELASDVTSPAFPQRRDCHSPDTHLAGCRAPTAFAPCLA